ncbi:hypothetical protein GCM10009678_20620 [Actinomadura kijaniata]|uniref:DoxX family protein n=1 Tax=Actinomadura namibiensis TaxID=182080 RepID=A0A7W3LJ50_ACTNM|nr:DoxX family protein [Actinomadura namibiensis]MBA8949044.1 hypothetical protein [Actinomadura namibiensis]
MQTQTWNRIRTIAFWATTLVIVAELVAGTIWNLKPIEWVEIQLRHLGYPDYFAGILGFWHAAAAAAIIAPGLPLIKEWAYAGVVLMWSGAVLSHLSVGDGPVNWGPPLMFTTLAVASWALRPADRRLRRDRPAGTGPERPGPSAAARPRAWAVPAEILAALFAVMALTLPTVEDFMREQAVAYGWIDK